MKRRRSITSTTSTASLQTLEEGLTVKDQNIRETYVYEAHIFSQRLYCVLFVSVFCSYVLGYMLSLIHSK
jgi:hypothetical protein